MGIIQSAEGLYGTKADLLEVPGCQQTNFRLHLQHRLFLAHQQTAFGLELQLLPESLACQPPLSDFGLTKPLKSFELILHKKSLSIYLSTSYWLCFSGEP